MIPAASIIHHHGIQPEPAHLVLLVIGLALVVLGAFLGGVHVGRTMPDDRDEPVEDASEDSVCVMGDDHPCGFCTGAEIDCPGYGFVPDGPTRDEAARAVAEQETT